ncbi:MAG: hypothetical protein M1814_006799, partial [Vezdaea aestivalis]
MASRGHDGRPNSSDEAKKDMWSSMLDSVASGKKLPEKTVLVLGGTPTTQRNFLEFLSLDTADPRRSQATAADRLPPIANRFALGYTYRDVLDADHEDTLARLSLYLLSEPSASFSPLIRPLLTPQTIPHAMVVILLDWAQPWNWLRQLQEWVCLLRGLLQSLNDDTKDVLEEVMIDWRDRARGNLGMEPHTNPSVGNDGDVVIPRGPGEWDEALGLPLCVVCQNAENMDTLEKEYAWKDDEFDFVLQLLRTVLLKHGSSLIYTSTSLPGSLQHLVHSTLGIHSLLKRQPLKHNVVDRDRILVPPKWDSWGKIRVLRDGFDVEGVSSGWSLDLQQSRNSQKSNGTGAPTSGANSAAEPSPSNNEEGALALFESAIKKPQDNGTQEITSQNTSGLEIESLDAQEFLTSQLEILQRLQAEEDSQSGGAQGASGSTDRSGPSQPLSSGLGSKPGYGPDDSRVNEHIGPVQTNVGGIQMDADDVLKRIMDREASRPQNEPNPYSPPADGKTQNEALASFFSGLMNRTTS